MDDPSNLPRITPKRNGGTLHSLFLNSQFSGKSSYYPQNARTSLLKHLKVSQPFKGPEDESAVCLFCLNWSPDGSLLASAAGNTIHIWDPDTKKVIHRLESHEEVVTTLAWFNEQPGTLNASPRKLISGSLDMTIRVYTDFNSVATLKEHRDWIRCLALTQDNSTLLSGCVSSSIVGWDMNILKPLWSVSKAHTAKTPHSDLDTINGLAFCHHNNNTFLSGARDGAIKLWDMRTVPKSIISCRAHKGKLNNLTFSKDDRMFMTSGRDGCIRLWDTRKMFDEADSTKNFNKAVVQEFSKHTCGAYSINAFFMNDEKQIITGSEDKHVYIYDTQTAEVISKIKVPQHIVHLVNPRHYSNSIEFISSYVECSRIDYWTPQILNEAEIKPTPPKSPVAAAEEAFNLSQHVAIESLMRRHGDQILKIFHQHSLNFSSMDWESLSNSFAETNMLQMVDEMTSDVERAFEFCAQEGLDHEKVEQYLNRSAPPKPSLPNAFIGEIIETVDPAFQRYRYQETYTQPSVPSVPLITNTTNLNSITITPIIRTRAPNNPQITATFRINRNNNTPQRVMETDPHVNQDSDSESE